MSAVPETALARFRPMRDTDLPAVMQTETAAYPHPWTEGIFRDCLRAGYNCWVIEQGDRLVGHAVMSVAVGECHILNICVHPDLQGHGLGRRLMEHLLRLARGYGAKMALLEVRPSNMAAVAMYESMDFSEVGRRRNYYPDGPGHNGDREDALVMALGLEGDE
ncbi:MAG: ribosomal protein S18-alanine N-acetyltransferase [Gammaproteobacteria bacterium]|nr:ribosomal protein S18-alanine N-acetyltransferase [Gammaproteobacteria bacterium]